MSKVRRKSSDSSIRPYLLKAKNEGILLSWDRYEGMLPQDELASIGLFCHDCLQGPCRLDPLAGDGVRTICGLTGEELVYRTIERLVSRYCDFEVLTDSLSCACDDNSGLISHAQRYLMKLKSKCGPGPAEGTAWQAGLGMLKKDYVNICLEGVSPGVINLLAGLARELEEEAKNKGAKGFNIVLAGDLNPDYPYPAVCNAGATEIALLTGLVDLYAVGAEGLGLGRNVVPFYHTVLVQAGQGTCKTKVKSWLAQAVDAYAKRDENKILVSEQIGAIPLVDLADQEIKEQMANGCIRGICILGGGSNLKVTEDVLICEAAVRLGSQNVLCLTYGNAAVTLGKYGYLAEGSLDSSGMIGKIFKREKSSLAYCVGSESEIVKIVDLVQKVGGNKVIALYPELTTGRDLLAAIALAGAGAQIFTAIKLPLAGSKEAASELSKLVTSVEASEFTDQALAFLGCI